MKKLNLLTIFAAIICLNASNAFAIQSSNKDNSRVKSPTVTSSQAAKSVQKKYGGKVLKVQKNKGKQSYKVKVIKPNGRIVSVDVDGKSGKVKGKN